jgi:hypothetical protein
MKWRKLKHFLPEIPGLTYAAMPTYFEGQLYWSPRDKRNRSYIFRADFDLATLKLGEPQLVHGPGKPGDFDDSGVMVSWIERDGPRVMLYFIGWNVGVTVPFRNSIGLAVNYEKFFGPVLDRSQYDPYFVASCCGGLRWYVSGIGWRNRDPERPFSLEPVYHIVNRRPHSPAITFENHETEWAIARPCVIQGRGYEMWYCYRGDEYRLGYATSLDGLQWQRHDEQMGIAMGEPGDFDDRAQCYPFVFDAAGKRFMFYNGNNYGCTGFGLAVLD